MADDKRIGISVDTSGYDEGFNRIQRRADEVATDMIRNSRELGQSSKEIINPATNHFLGYQNGKIALKFHLITIIIILLALLIAVSMWYFQLKDKGTFVILDFLKGK